jgi:hypothetical protein
MKRCCYVQNNCLGEAGVELMNGVQISIKTSKSSTNSRILNSSNIISAFYSLIIKCTTLLHLHRITNFLFNLNIPSVQDPIIKMPFFKHSLIAIASLVSCRQVTKPLKHVSLHLTNIALHKHHQTATKPPPGVQGQWSDSASAQPPSPQSCLQLSSPTPQSQSPRQLPSRPPQSVPIPLSFPPPRLRLLRTFFEGKNASLQAPIRLQAHMSHLRTKWTLLWTQIPRRN